MEFPLESFSICTGLAGCALLEERTCIRLPRTSVKAGNLHSQVIGMGDMARAFPRSEAVSVPAALVMGTHVPLAEHEIFGERILDSVFCLREPSEGADS